MMTIPRVEEIILDSTCRREVDITSRPMGDLMHLWAVELVRNDEPTAQDVIKLAKGEWLYRIVRFSISLRKLAARADIVTTDAMKNSANSDAAILMYIS
jgi:hypothetical protein